MRAQVQAVAVAHGHLDSVMPGVMRGGLVPVPVGGEDFAAGQFGQVGQAVGQLRMGGGQHRLIDLLLHRATASAVEAGEIVGQAGGLGVPRPVLVQKGPSTGAGFQHALHAQNHRLWVAHFRTSPGVETPGGQAVERLEKGVVHRLVFQRRRH